METWISVSNATTAFVVVFLIYASVLLAHGNDKI